MVAAKLAGMEEASARRYVNEPSFLSFSYIKFAIEATIYKVG